jgi:hypothetical protein
VNNVSCSCGRITGNTEIIPDRSPLVRSFTRYVTINALVFYRFNSTCRVSRLFVEVTCRGRTLCSSRATGRSEVVTGPEVRFEEVCGGIALVGFDRE